ncbi:MAG: oligosaccharide flippase family protein [Pirellulales bacterium]
MNDFTATTSPGSLRRAVRRGAGALARAQVASQIVSIASLAILLRLLAPQDYGLLAMIVPLLLFLRIFTTLGLNSTTVQRSELNDAEVAAAFWIQLAAGILVAITTMALAPWVGWFYGKPESADTLRNLTVALAGTSILAALGAQPQALLERRLQMRTLGKIRVIAQLAGAAAAIIAAWRGAGVWALVFQQYVELVLLAGFCFVASQLRPARPTALSGIVRHIQLGGWFAATTVVLFIGDNLDRVLVGRLVSAADVGLYSQAYNLMIKPVYLVTTPLTALALAALSRAARHPATAQQLIESFHRMVAIALLPLSLGLALVGSDVMLALGGAAWRDAGPLFSVLSLGMFGQAIVVLNGYALMASGRAKACFAASLLLAFALAAGYFTGWQIGKSYQRPALGIAGGYAATILLIGLGPHAWFCLRAAGHDPAAVMRTWLPAAIAAIAMAIGVAAASWLVPKSYAVLQMALQISVGVATYGWLARGELRWLTSRLVRGQPD